MKCSNQPTVVLLDMLTLLLHAWSLAVYFTNSNNLQHVSQPFPGISKSLFVYSHFQQASSQNSSKYTEDFFSSKTKLQAPKNNNLFFFNGLISSSNYCSGPLSEALGKIQMEMSLAGAF